MSKEEDKRGIVVNEETEEEGMVWSDVQQWYLEQREDQMNTEEELDKETEIVNKVIHKLIKEGFLVVVGTRGEQDEDTRIKLYPGIDPSRF
jgi:DNA replication licensing factor MCM6